jgi:ATP-dependent DNA helicase RecQ
MSSSPAKDRLPASSHSLASSLKQHFGFEEFRPGQEAIVRDILDGRDVLAIMPTGGGKSLCFQLPAVLHGGLTLVISPLIALMQDQVRLLQDHGIEATFINSSLPHSEIAVRLQATNAGKYKLLYLAPERVLQAEFLNVILPRLIASPGVAAIVIDEAHCVSEWGHDFRREYRQLANIRKRHSSIPMLAFTATATTRVREDILQQLALRDPAVHLASFNRPNLFYAVRAKTKRTYAELAARCKSSTGSGIVYCLSRKRVDEVASALRADGISALPYHAGLSAEDRHSNQEAFINDDAQVIVATIAFGMGINKPDVRWVVHYDLPRTLESYYQESGRAGRDGDDAECILYFGPGDIRTAEFLIQQKIDPISGEPLVEEQRIARQQLRQVLNYAESQECRRTIQLAYFGEKFSPPCNGCDNCRNPQRTEDRTVEAQQFLSCIARLAQRGDRFGAAYVIDILRGAKSERVISNGHTDLSVYGIGRQRSLAEWRGIARTMLHQGLMSQSSDSYGVLTLNPLSWEILRGTRTVHVAVTMPSKESRPAKELRSAAEASDNEAIDMRLFDALRALRKKLATEHHVPPYVIFHDATLKRIALRRPSTREEFLAIPGVGQTKLERYADTFIAEVQKKS